MTTKKLSQDKSNTFRMYNGILPTVAVLDVNLSGTSLMVLAVIVSACMPEGGNWPTNEAVLCNAQIGANIGRSERVVRAAVSQLKKAGWITEGGYNKRRTFKVNLEKLKKV